MSLTMHASSDFYGTNEIIYLCWIAVSCVLITHLILPSYKILADFREGSEPR